MTPLEQLKKAIAEYDIDGTRQAAEAAVADGIDPLDALAAITFVLNEIGTLFGEGELFLPDLIAAAHTAQAGLSVVEAEMLRTGKTAKVHGTVVVGTVAGDIHDIGKSMVSSLLIAHGFKVVDLGTDVSTPDFVAAVKQHQPDVLALSALLTTTAAQQKKVIDALVEAGLRDSVKIMVGGGAVNADFAASIGADCYGETAAEAVELAKQLVGVAD